MNISQFKKEVTEIKFLINESDIYIVLEIMYYCDVCNTPLYGFL